MKKETIIAVSLGIGAGILIALLVIFVSRQTNSGNTIISEAPTPTVTLERDVVEPLTIIRPKSESIVATKQITIVGRAPKNSLLVVASTLQEEVVKTDTLSFSVNFPVAVGENIIKITSYTGTTTDTRTLKIYYVENE